MAETTEKTRKAKAPAKPRATGATAKPRAKKTTKATAAAEPAALESVSALEKVTSYTPTHEEIAQLARQYWEERGWQDGQAEQDWLRAERALMQMAS